MPSANDEAEERLNLAREVRAGLAFEHMIGAGLFGGVASAGGSLIFSLVGVGLTLTAVLGAILKSLAFGVVVFLLAFAASILVFTPLYMLLEKNRVRKIWPFYVAAFAVQFAVLGLAGQAPSFDAPQRFLYLLPGFLIVFLFGRRIVPLWQAADRAAAAAAPFRLIQ